MFYWSLVFVGLDAYPPGTIAYPHDPVGYIVWSLVLLVGLTMAGWCSG